MERPTNPAHDEDASAERPSQSASNGTVERRLVDRLPECFTLARSESEWLLTLLSADELRFIFEGTTNDKPPN